MQQKLIIKMFSLKLFMIFVFSLSLSSYLFTLTSAADPTYIYHTCSDQNFTRNSTYQSNIYRLLSSLTTNDNNSSEFYKVTVGQDPDEVHGLFQCRGDVTTTTCQECVAAASRNITQLCPDQVEAIIWYDECFLRYTDTPISYTTGLNNGPLIRNQTGVPVAPQRFQQLVLELLGGAATQAANDPRKFATRKGNSTTSQPLYGLVQCTQDLSNNDCSGCLQEATANMQSGMIGGRTLLPNCNSRYELYLFYNENLTTSLPPAPMPTGKSQIASSIIIAIVATVSAVLVAAGYCFLTRRARKNNNKKEDEIDGIDITSIELLQFDFEIIQEATNRFSTANKLGEGGFGEVYKGVLYNKQEIAVKRLSKSSCQGVEEFKNEVVLVAKLQHRNLVRLLGFCLDREERILIYEFVPNKSLDYFLFDPEKQRLLGWSKRYRIIEGIARGIHYLHEDSRLKIIHRDLKPSNILLDENMNPKISDFGMARIFGVDQIQGNTHRIVGTYGYMAPEYAMRGQFSMKSDVFSFGVLVLEIITGQKNSSFFQTAGVGNLLSFAWKQWRDGTPLHLLDPTLTDSYSRNEVMRCIHLGLLCVEEDPSRRPTMGTVDLMLNSYSVTLPLPKQPAFFLHSKTGLKMQGTSNSTPSPVDGASITEVYPR